MKKYAVVILVLMLSAFIINGNNKKQNRQIKYLLNSPDKYKRISITKLLTKYKDYKEYLLLTKLFDDDAPLVRKRGVEWSIKFSKEIRFKYIDKITKQSTSDNIILSLVMQIEMDPYPEGKAVLLKYSKHKNSQIRYNIINALYNKYAKTHNKPDKNIISYFNDMLMDKNNIIRAEGLEKLILLRSISKENIEKEWDGNKYIPKMGILYGLEKSKNEDLEKYLIRAFDEKAWQLKALAIKMASYHITKSLIEKIMKNLDKEKGRLLYESKNLLIKLTNRDLGSKTQSWLDWWHAAGDSFELNSTSPKAVLAGTHTSTKFYGLPVVSKKVVFILDLSGSMKKEEGEKKGVSRLEKAINECLNVIKCFDKDVFFNIILLGCDRYGNYNLKNKCWSNKLKPASLKNKYSAGLFLENQQPYGWTNIYDALEYGLRQKNLDTIYLLSDGRATKGKFVAKDDMIEELKVINKYKLITIHSIVIGKDKRGINTMRVISDLTGGYCAINE